MSERVDLTADKLATPEGALALNNMLRFLYSKIINAGDDVDISSGYGTPEGAVTKKIGSLFLRLDGGASTSFYVKESGTGATGWVAK